MRVLVLSITAGGGHNSTANAIQSCFTNQGVECRVLDTFEYSNKLLSRAVSEGYLFITSKAKIAFEEGYRLAEKRKRTADDRSQTRLNGRLLSRKLRKYIAIYDPDVIIYTHIFAGIILDVIKVEHGLRAKTVGILTDFVFHPYWEEAVHLDYVVTACDHLLCQAQKKGFSAEQILPMGIPIHPKFAKKEDAAAVRRSLGLDPDRTTLLLMGGSMGYGNITETVEQLYAVDREFQLIAVCGSNEKAKGGAGCHGTSQTHPGDWLVQRSGPPDGRRRCHHHQARRTDYLGSSGQAPAHDHCQSHPRAGGP